MSVVLMAVLLGGVFANPQIDGVIKTVYALLFTALFYCCLAYQLNRYGAAQREAAPSASPPPADPELPVAILIPSYREERRVLISTVLSAALARHGNRRIVVLLDDPPADSARPHSLAAVADVRHWLGAPMARLRDAAAQWRGRASLPFDAVAEGARLAAHYRFAARFLDDLGETVAAEGEPDFAHVDGFLQEAVIRALAAHYRSEAEAVEQGIADAQSAAGHYRRLATLFCDDISTFERKQYLNLPHAANKAMNLNAYIGLLGGSYSIREGKGGRMLEAAGPGAPAELVVPAARYVLTLDADSIIRPQYIADLLALIEADPGIGVVQTPYRAFPGATSPVERIAGATTDMQYLVHQGSVRYEAAFWVGANALIRVDALMRIATTQEERGYRHRVFVQDRTVIEDTGSTVDLMAAGYRVHNHFKPLAYSATPADFGSLAVQRQRWSNGGLIIFPQLWAEYGWSGLFRRGPELALRAHYLLSPAIGNTAVFLLMVLLSTDARNLLLMPLAMAPYFVLYAIDLRRNGYRARDIVSVSALNLMLLPVGFAGVAASILQMATGEKGTFWRTPKVAGRTRVHPFYILFCLGLVALMAHYLVEGIRAGQYVESVFPALNLGLLGYGFVRFIGLRPAMADLAMPLLSLPAGLWLRAGRRGRRLVAASLLGLAGALVPASQGPAISGPESLPATSVTPLDSRLHDAALRPAPASMPRDRAAGDGS